MTAKDLKNALLQEAVQGKLVTQITSEGNAKDLLEEIKNEKAKLIKEGKLKKEKPFSEITEDEIPFDIPENWCWCRLGDVTCKLTDGSHNPPPPKNTGYPVISAMNIKNGKITFDNVNRYTDQIGFEKENPRTNISSGDIIMGIIGGSIGNIAIYDSDKKVIAQRSISIINSFISNYYISIILQSPFIQSILHDSKGTAQGGIYLGSLKNLPIPLPPLAEQKRIVNAINQFMPLIKEYGKKETELTALNADIAKTLKNAILQEAVQGKLAPQIASEGNAKDLLEEIKKEKAKLIKEGKLKKEKTLPEITEDEIPFDIPENWCWCKVGDLFSTMSGLGYKKEVLNEKTNKMIRVLRGGNILDTSYLFKDDDIMISSNYVKPELFLKKNYLITPAVTSLDHIGKVGYIEKDYEDTVVGGFVLMIIPHVNDEIISKYCLYLFGTRWFRDMCKEITHKSGQAFYNLSRDKFLQLPIPLPTKSEQKRIIETIEKMLPLCEKITE